MKFGTYTEVSVVGFKDLPLGSYYLRQSFRSLRTLSNGTIKSKVSFVVEKFMKFNWFLGPGVFAMGLLEG